MHLNAAINAAILPRSEVGAVFPRSHASPAFGLSSPYSGKTKRPRSETAEDQGEEEVSWLAEEEVSSKVKAFGRVRLIK